MAKVSAGTGKYVSQFNQGNNFRIQFKMTTGAAAADVLQCQIPDHNDKDAVPLSAVAYSRAVTGVVTSKPLTITSHQVTPDSGQTAAEAIGVSLITVGATALVAGDIVQINYSSTKFVY